MGTTCILFDRSGPCLWQFCSSLVFFPLEGGGGAGADPGFPVGGLQGAPTYDFAKFREKLHEIEKILGRGGGGAGPHFKKRLQQNRLHRRRLIWLQLLFLMLLYDTGWGDGIPSMVQIALCFGLIVGTMVWCIRHISGGHINPAVTVALLVTRKISVVRAVLFVVAQCLGAIIGAAFLKVTTKRLQPRRVLNDRKEYDTLCKKFYRKQY